MKIRGRRTPPHYIRGTYSGNRSANVMLDGCVRFVSIIFGLFLLLVLIGLLSL